MKAFPQRGAHVTFAGRTWRVDAIHHCASACTVCGVVHEALTLGRPGEYVGRARGCQVGAA